MNELNPEFDDIRIDQNKRTDEPTPKELLDHANELADGWFKPVNPFIEPVEPLNFIIDDFAARGMITLIGGIAGAGKSMVSQYLLQLRDGQNLMTTAPGTAIYLTGMDSSEREIRRRAKNIGRGDGLMTVTIPDTVIPFISDPVFCEDLKKNITEHDVDVIVFDTLADFHQGSLYEASDANATMSAFRRLAEATNAAIILITHIRKSADLKTRFSVNDIADSRVFGTKSDFVFGIKSEYQSDNSNLIEIQCSKSRSQRIMPDLRALIKYDEDQDRVTIERTNRPFSAEVEKMGDKERIAHRREEAQRLTKDGKSLRFIAAKLGVSAETIRSDLKSVNPDCQGVDE